MPGREINAKKIIPAIYKRGHLETLMFGHVNCLRYNFPSTSVDKAIQQFQKYYNISEDDYPLKTARRTFYRMNEELIELSKSNDGSCQS